MKILLTTLNSKFIHSNLALKYLYESAGIYRDLLEIREFTINNDDMSIYMEIMRGGYDAICFSCYIWNITKTLGLIRDIKNSVPDIKIVIGGPEVSYGAEELLETHPEIDLVIQGEGDRAFPEFLKAFTEGSFDFSQKIFLGEVPSADEIPFPYEHQEIDKNKILYYESARGCPYNCSFCLSSASHGVRHLPLDRVKCELDFFLRKNVAQVKFVDRTFNADVKRAAEIMNYIISNDNGITNFHFELCGDRISAEMIDCFNRARDGLFQIEIGVQSTCTEALEACGRRVDFEALKKNVMLLGECRGLHIHLDLIAGLPYESFERFTKSFDDVYNLNPHDLQLGFLKLIKGTKIRNEAEKHGYVFRDREPYEIISNDYINAGELVKLKMVEHVLDLFHNKPGFRETVKYIIENYENRPFDFYESLAEYYYGRNYHLSPQPKNALYDILWDFIEEKGYENRECLKELLLYDKISVASPSGFSCREEADRVHSWLRDNLVRGEVHAKDLVKKVNYMKFTYNVEEYAQGMSCLKKGEDRLLLFFPEHRNGAGQARCINLG